MATHSLRIVLILFALTTPVFESANAATTIDGELRRWHPIALTFEGPEASEYGDVNPFLDFRLDVTFSHTESGTTVVVPGYFAADGDAANTGADSGNKWRVHFVAREIGQWVYEISFRSGKNVSIDTDPGAGEPAAPDGDIGSFTIAESDKAGRDHRGKGILSHVGERHPRFDNGEYFLKAGADAPETLLAYRDFDNTYDHGGGNSIKSYQPHIRDWNPGDPLWQDGKGAGLIGAVNYLAGKGMNAFSFLTMNVTGDGKNVWPWTSHVERYRFDVSKLAQWEIVFSHADKLGMFLHFKTQETENDQLLDGGTLGPQRKLYYRELIARFAHHLALNWNLGEENDTWEELDDPNETNIKAFISYISKLDPYDHPIVVHSYPDQQDEVYTPLLGEASGLHGVSLQAQIENVHADTLRWVRESASAGKQWMVANDEIGPANDGVKPDGEGNNHFDTRYRSLWGNLMAGGWGVEYYFGYRHAHSDLNAEDWASRDISWDQARFALQFFNTYLPFTEMHSADELTPGEDDYVYAKKGDVYAIYLPRVVETSIDLGDRDEEFSVGWYNPRRGGALQQGTIGEVEGPGLVFVGQPPANADLDWVVLIQRR
jgi:hypothetical protein